MSETVCKECGQHVAPNCKNCGKRLGTEYHELSGTYHQQRKFYFRDCADCGQQVMRMVKTWD